MFAKGLEIIVTAGMIAAPTVTVATTACMIGAAAYVMAPLCAQAMIDTVSFGGACITGQWDKVEADFDNFGKFISKPEIVARMAELAGGAAMPTPNLTSLVEQILSLRPVITSVQQASGKAAQSLYLMTKNQLQKVYQQSVELLQLPEFANFNCVYKNICGVNFFDILPKNNPALAPAFSGIESELLATGEQAALTQLFTQSQGQVAGNAVKSTASYIISNKLLESNYAFSKTELGQNMLTFITKDYEEIMFVNIAKEYDKLLASQASQEIIHNFCRCHELSIVPKNIKEEFINLHQVFENKYPGLPEFNTENQYLTMQMRHIFYPSLKFRLNADGRSVKEYILNGFHHDEYASLEKAEKVEWKNKVYEKSEFGAEECFMAKSDWGNEIICDVKTFFPSSWSKEKVAQVIFEATQNRIEDISDPIQKNQKNIYAKGLIIC